MIKMFVNVTQRVASDLALGLEPCHQCVLARLRNLYERRRTLCEMI
jgi:hypothetical protein